MGLKYVYCSTYTKGCVISLKYSSINNSHAKEVHHVELHHILRITYRSFFTLQCVVCFPFPFKIRPWRT